MLHREHFLENDEIFSGRQCDLCLSSLNSHTPWVPQDSFVFLLGSAGGMKVLLKRTLKEKKFEYGASPTIYSSSLPYPQTNDNHFVGNEGGTRRILYAGLLFIKIILWTCL